MTTHSQYPVTGLRREEEGKDPDRRFEKERDDGHEHDGDRNRRPREHDHEHQPEHEHEERRRPDHPSEARI
ncbi:metal transporter [Ralstonia sp. A12]|uniref:metal transporter n=1 Tax=Ralstonia sp. A12 TaxID=1217052 RepID=UPI000A006FFB|nr:metal transporter [Ralstonia sp. A12]